MQADNVVKFKVGDRVRVDAKHHRFGNKEGVVVPCKSTSTCVEFPGSTFGHCGDFKDTRETCWYFFPSESVGAHRSDSSALLSLVAAAPPGIAADLRLTPQARTVLAHIKRNKSISPTEALIVYGISRLASCIHEIRKRAGYSVLCEIRKDAQSHKYARYSLATIH